MSKEEASRLPSIGIEAFIRDPVMRAACRDEIRRVNIRHKSTPESLPEPNRTIPPSPEPNRTIPPLVLSHDEIQ